VLGVIPGNVEAGTYEAMLGYPNPWVEVVVRTHLPHSGHRGREVTSRNHINVLSSDVIVALPGSDGTRSEIELALRYGRPLIAYQGPAAAMADLPAAVPVARDLEAVQSFVLGAVAIA
jgi:hypothetical protein